MTLRSGAVDHDEDGNPTWPGIEKQPLGGRQLGRLMADVLDGLPVTLSAELLASHLAVVDRPVDLSAAEQWTLTGDSTLTPVD